MRTSNSEQSLNIETKGLLKKIVNSNAFYFGVGHVSFLLGRLLRDVILARLVGTQMFGTWAAFSILRQYGAYSDLGLFNGLSREIPRVKDDLGLSRSFCGAAALGTFISSSIVMIWFYFFRSGEFIRDTYTHSMIVLMLFFVGAEKVYKYYHSVFLGFSKIKEAGLFLFVLSFLDLVLAIGGAYLWGLLGVLIATTIAVLLTAVAMHFFRPIDISLTFSKSTVKALVSSSTLLMCFGLMNVALKNIDRTVFVYLNGDESVLGAHHAASLLAMAVGIVPFIFISVVNPKIYSLHEKHDVQFYNILRKYGTACCISGCLVAIIVYFLSPYVVSVVFPNQPFAKEIAPYLIVAEVFVAASLVVDAIIVVKNRGIFILAYKFLTLATIMLAQILYVKNGNFENSIELAVILSKSLMYVHIFCFLGSFCYLSVLIRRGLDFKKMKPIFLWPFFLIITLLIIT